MGMKLPIAATSIVCSACIAASVAAPAVDLPEKSVKSEAARSVTQDYKLLAVTDPITGAVTLIALPLQDLGKIDKFFADNLLSPLFTLASSPLNIPTQISNQVPPETAIQNNITVPIQELQAFPAALAALIQDLGGADAMAARGPNVALAADPVTGLTSPLADLGQIDKFFADNLISPLFTLASSPLNIPTQISNQVPPETAIQNNITVPIGKLEGLPRRTRRPNPGHLRWRKHHGGRRAQRRTGRGPGTGLDSLASPLADLGQIDKFFSDNLISPAFTIASSPLNIPTQISNQVPPKRPSRTTSPFR